MPASYRFGSVDSGDGLRKKAFRRRTAEDLRSLPGVLTESAGPLAAQKKWAE
jgi:hypothetical protein